MTQFPQYAQRPVSPAPLSSYLDPVKPPRRPSRIRSVLRKGVLYPLLAAGAVAAGAWGSWTALQHIGGSADAAPVVSDRPTGTPGPPVPQPHHTEYSPASPTVVTEDGMYIVGKQIKPGTYRATCGARNTCVWQRYRVVDGVATAVAGGTALPGESVLVELSTADFSFGVIGFGSWTAQ